MSPSKKVLIIAGPNGAGKTAFATEFLLNEADCPTFVNADLIASGVNPFQPERSAVLAGRLMLDMIEDYVLDGESHSPQFEITLSGRGRVCPAHPPLAGAGLLGQALLPAAALGGHGRGTRPQPGPRGRPRCS